MNAILSGQLRSRVLIGMILSFTLIVLGIALKYNGHGVIIVYVFWFLYASAIYFFVTTPDIWAILATLEVTRRVAGGTDVDANGVTNNIIVVAPALTSLWLSIVFMFIASLPLEYFMSLGQAISLTFTALMFITVIGFSAFFKWTTEVYYKKIIVGYAVIGLLVCVIQIPLYFTNSAFYGAAGTSKTAIELRRAEHAVKVANDEDLSQDTKDAGEDYKRCKGDENCMSPEHRRVWRTAKRINGELTPDFSKPKAQMISMDIPVKQAPKPNPAPTAAPAPAPEPQKESGANKITISGKYSIHATMVEAAKKYGQKNPLEVDMLVTTSTHEGDTVKFVTQENIYTCQLQPNGDCDGQWSPKGKSNGQPLHFHFHSDERADGWIMDGGLKADAIIYGI